MPINCAGYLSSFNFLHYILGLPRSDGLTEAHLDLVICIISDTYHLNESVFIQTYYDMN
jgi:hypothetical protein